MGDTGLEKFILDKLEKLDDKLDEVKIDQAKSRKSFEAHEDKDDVRHKELKDMYSSIGKKLDEQHESLDEYNKQLEIHIEGVNTLKQSQEKMWGRTKPAVEKFEHEAAAQKWLSDRMKTRMKYIGYIGTIVGTAIGVLKLLDMI